MKGKKTWCSLSYIKVCACMCVCINILSLQVIVSFLYVVIMCGVEYNNIIFSGLQ